MSSNSSSAALSGVSRFSSRPGRCRMTWRRRPTSEATWNMALIFPAGPGPDQLSGCPGRLAYAAAMALDLGLAAGPLTAKLVDIESGSGGEPALADAIEAAPAALPPRA